MISKQIVAVLLIMSSSRLFTNGFVRGTFDQPHALARFHASATCLRSSSAACKDESQHDFASEADDAGLKETKLHSIRWVTASDANPIEFHAFHGETLRSAALKRGVVSPHNGKANLINCRGLGTCGTCAVEIQGDVQPIERNKVERIRLALPPHDPAKSSSLTLRLACQVKVHGDLTVTKRTGFWGQGQEIAEQSLPTKPFGDLEYLLDTNDAPDRSSTKSFTQ